MKKFFDFSITSRKQVKGEDFAKVAVFSKQEKQIGELIFKNVKTDDYKAIFAKYFPVNDFNSESISKLQIIEDKNHELKDMLNTILSGINTQIKSEKKNFFEALILKIFITTCIDLESGIILIPTELLDINITNNDILENIGEDWLGFEVKVDFELEKIKEKFKTEK